MRLFVQKYKNSTVLRLGHYVDVEIFTKVITVTIKTYSLLRELEEARVEAGVCITFRRD